MIIDELLGELVNTRLKVQNYDEMQIQASKRTEFAVTNTLVIPVS